MKIQTQIQTRSQGIVDLAKRRAFDCMIVLTVIGFLTQNVRADATPIPDGGTTSVLLGGVAMGLVALRKFLK